MTILILGASSDLGNAIAIEYARQGHSLILTGRNAERLDASRRDLSIRYPVDVQSVMLDACDFEAHDSFSQEVDLAAVDVVVCTFGYLGDQEIAQENFPECRQIIETNFLGAVSLLNRVAQVFVQKGAGTIIGISSVAGERGRQSNYFYGSAKAGFTTYLDGLRNQLAAHQVHVMTVKPGFMRTKMTEGLDLPGPLTASAEKAAIVIVKAAKKGRNTVYVLPIWKWIMLIIRNIPEPIFKKMKL